MKSLLVIFSLIFAAGIGAQASAQQTKECGSNVRQIQRIIDEHEDWDLPANYTKRFLGSWGKDGALKIEAYGNFAYGEYTFQACPQKDGSFYIMSKNPVGYNGWLRMNLGKVEIKGFTGFASALNSTYVKASGNAVANGGRNEF